MTRVKSVKSVTYLRSSELNSIAPMIRALTAQPRLEVGDVQRSFNDFAVDPLACIAIVTALRTTSVVSQHIIAIVPQHYDDVSKA